MAEMMLPGMGPPQMPQEAASQGQLPPDLELEAGQVNPDGIFTQIPGFRDLPPEIAMKLVEMIKQLMQTGQLPPELAQGGAPGMEAMPPGMPQGGRGGRVYGGPSPSDKYGQVQIEGHGKGH